MAQSEQQAYNFSFSNTLVFLYKWRKMLGIVTAFALLTSAGVSYLIKPKYKSTVILFPTTDHSVSKSLLEDHKGTEIDYLQFGEENQAEQMLQILNSDEIRNKIAQRYNLLEHYDINPNDPMKNTHLKNMFDDNVTFKRTEYLSIKIDVLDHDPLIASNMANDIAAMVDSVRNRMTHERASAALQIVENQYTRIKTQVKEMEDSMDALRELGVYDYELQVRALSKASATAKAKGDAGGVKSIEADLEILKKYGGNYVNLKERLFTARGIMGEMKERHEMARANAEKFLSYKFVVNNAFPADKKSYPIRWLIVLIATASAFLVAVMLIMMIENFSKIKFND